MTFPTGRITVENPWVVVPKWATAVQASWTAHKTRTMTFPMGQNIPASRWAVSPKLRKGRRKSWHAHKTRTTTFPMVPSTVVQVLVVRHCCLKDPPKQWKDRPIKIFETLHEGRKSRAQLTSMPELSARARHGLVSRASPPPLDSSMTARAGCGC